MPLMTSRRTLASTAALLIGLGLAPAANAAISFEFNYLDAAGFGFNDATNGTARKNALETSALQFSNLFSSIFTESGTLTMDVTGSDDSSSSTLASAGSALVLSGSAPAGFNIGEVVRAKLQTGTDLNDGDADGTVNVNFGQPWELDLTATPSDSQYDFYSTMYHEFFHALGFASSMSQDGSPVFGDKSAGNWVAFDQFIVDKNGNPVIDPSSFALNQSTWDAASVGGASPADGLFFNGSFAVAANGGQPLGLYSPNPWEGGSSSAHLDDQNPALAGLMMLAATDTGPGARTLSAVEIGVLRDIGYTVAAVPEPESYAMMLAGLAMLGAIAKRRTR